MIWSLVVAAAVASAPTFESADKQLNQTYQKLLPRLPQAARPKLADTQIKWVKYRDAWAALVRDQRRADAGAWQGARITVTQQRAADFQDVLAQLGHPHRVGEGVADQVAAVDQQLNRNYQALLGALEAPSRKLVTAAEVAWLAYRDADLAFTEAWRHDAGARANRLYELTQLQADALAAVKPL